MKFKVGDKVKVTNCDHDPGEIGVIEDVKDMGYKLFGWWHAEKCLSLAEIHKPPEEEPIPTHLMIHKLKRVKEE